MSPSINPDIGLLYVVTLEMCDIYTGSAKEPVPSAEERISLMSTDKSLMAPAEPHMPHRLSQFENFSLDDPRGDEAAVARKLLTVLNAMIRTQADFAT